MELSLSEPPEGSTMLLSLSIRDLLKHLILQKNAYFLSSRSLF